MTEAPEDHFVKHGPCDSCGSSDANALFSDGHSYCFSCQKRVNGDAPSVNDAAAVTPKNLVRGLRYLDLPKRGLTAATCAFWGYGVGSYGGEDCQVANYYDKDGALVAQKLRFAGKRFVFLGDTKRATLFGQHLWRDGGKYVVVTEGEIDAISLSHVQGNRWATVSIPNGASGAKKAVAANLDWLLSFEKVVFMFDSDEPGRLAAIECADLLPPGRAAIATLPLKDANEMLVASRGAELRDAIWGAKTYRPDGILDCDQVLERLKTSTAPVPICGWHFPGLQRKIGGVFRGRLVTFTGGSGSGKTEVVRTETNSAMEQGAKVGVISLEETVERAMIGYIGLRLKTRLDLVAKPLEVPGFMEAYNALRHRAVFYDHHGSLDGDNIIQRIRYMRQSEECDIVVLDNLTVVSSEDNESNERKMLDAFVVKLQSLCQETGVTIFLVCHLKRPTGTPHEEGGQTSLAQLRGSGGIGAFSMEVIGIERNQQDPVDPNLVTVRVLKNRKTGFTGTAGTARYDPNSGIFFHSALGDGPMPAATPEEVAKAESGDF